MFLFIKVFIEENYMLLMITNIISDLPGDESAPLFLLTGLRALLKMHMHPFSMTQKSSTAHSNPARKEAKENWLISGSLLSISLVYTILLFLCQDMNIQKPNQLNKKLYEFMGERPWFDSTVKSLKEQWKHKSSW